MTTNYLYSNSSDSSIVIIMLCIIFVLIAFGIVKVLTDLHKRNKEIFKEWEKIDNSPELKEITARVVSKNCHVKTYGIKLPESKKEFFITFEKSDGTLVKYDVSEKLYLSVEENQTGTMAIVNDKLYDFCVDDEAV